MTPGSKTGVTAHYNRLIATLTERGQSATLLTPDDAPWLVRKSLVALGKLSRLIGGYVWIVFLEFSRFVSIWIAVRLLPGRGNFDIVHAQDVNTGAAVGVVLGQRVRLIATCHFNEDPLTEYARMHTLSPWFSQRLKAWFLYLFSKHDAFITVSEYIKQTSAFLRPPGAPCEVIHNGVDFPQPAPKPDSNELAIINVGTIEERKNQRLLIEAAGELRARGFTAFRIWFMGDGPKRMEWQQLIDNRGLGSLVSFEGFRPDVADYLKRASLYVHTATHESWGYSITEAIASGTPVLALETGGIPEQFGPERPGLLPVTSTATALAGAILAYRGKAERNRLADAQFRFASERFSLKTMTDRHIRFYKQVLEQFTTWYPAETTVDA